MQTDKPNRTYRREEEWRALINEFEESGLPAKEFCAKHNIAMSGLYTWRKKFESSSKAVDGPFIELSAPVKEVNSEPVGWDVELELDSNVVLRIRSTGKC